MTLRRTLLLLGALALGACDKGGGGGGSGGGSADDGLPAARGKPDGRGWDALGWVRASEAVAAEVSVLDAEKARAAYRSAGVELRSEDFLDVRRWLVGSLGLAEDAASVVLTFREKEEGQGRSVVLRAAKVKTSLDDVRKAALAHGGVESVESGAPAWRIESFGTTVTAWAEGWLLYTGGTHPEEIGRALAARRGEKALRSMPGLSEAVAALPDGLPMQLEWGPKFGDFGPVKPAPAAALTMASSAGPDGLGAFVFDSAADRAAARAPMEAQLKKAIEAKMVAKATFGDRGRVLLIAVVEAKAAERLVRRTRNELSSLRRALGDRKEKAGRFPTTAEGLAALAEDPNALDPFAGTVPVDAWGHAYRYVSPHPTRPDDVDLRSAGPDGALDTEDDVFPE